MATVNITPGKQFAVNEKWTRAGLNQLGTPTAALVPGTVAEADLTAGAQTKLNAITSAIKTVVAKAADFNVHAADKGTLFDVTTAGSNVTAILDAAATLGNNFYIWLRKADTGAGAVLTNPTTTPDAFALAKVDQKAMVYCDGTNFYVIHFHIKTDVNGNLFTLATFFGLGGHDATVPGFKRSGTTFAIRLGDDSADAPISAKDGTFSGVVSNNDTVALGNLTGATSIDASKGNSFAGTLTGNVTGLTLANMKNGQTVVLALTQDGTGSRTVAWAAGPKYSGGSAPTQTATANKTDIYTITQIAGTQYVVQTPNF